MHMKVDIPISEAAILSAVIYLIQTGQKPNYKNTYNLIKSMVICYGEQWDIEPTIEMEQQEVVSWETASELAIPIAKKLEKKIF